MGAVIDLRFFPGWTYGHARRSQIAARGLSPHPGFSLDTAQRPPQSSQGYDLLLLILNQDMLIGGG